MDRGYFAPAFTVKINSQPLKPDALKHITSISITNELNTIPNCALTLANPYPDMIWTHKEEWAELFKETNNISVDLGYVDDLHLLFDGAITGFSPDFPASGLPTVAIQAEGSLRRLRSPRRTDFYDDMTDSEIAQKIAKRNHLTLQADATQLKHPHLEQLLTSDFDFLRERARLINFEIAMIGKELFFRKPTYEKLYTLLWGHPKGDIDRNQTLMPLISFRPSISTTNQVPGVTVRGLDPLTREVIEGQAGPGDEDPLIGEGQTGADVAQTLEIDEPIINETVATQEEVSQIAQSEYNERARQFVTGDGMTIGLPRLHAGQLVQIQGLGYRFDGEYYVSKTVHTIDNSGYLTSFSVQRNTIG